MTQGQRDAIATAEARRDALLSEALEFRAKGCELDALMREAQAKAYEDHRRAILGTLVESERIAEAMRARGFVLEGTGGGCEAFIKYEEQGGKVIGQVMVTRECDPSVPDEMGEPVDVGYYVGEEGETCVMIMRFPSLTAFLAASQIQADELAFKVTKYRSAE